MFAFFLGVYAPVAPCAGNDFYTKWKSVDDRLSDLFVGLGRTIVRIEVENREEFPAGLLREIEALEGQPLAYSRLSEVVRWFHDSYAEARVEVTLEKVSGGVALGFEIFSKKRVNTISFEGVTKFEKDYLLELAKISKGSEYDQIKIERAVNVIRDFYRRKGYLQTKVEAEIEEAGRLKIVVSEGEVARIKSISISEIDGIQDRRLRTLLEEGALAQFDLDVGDELDRDKIKDGLIALKEWLKEEKFLIAKEPVANSVILDGGTTVHLDINVEYGPRIQFGFRNNSRFSYRELSQEVEDIEEVGVGTDYLEFVRSRLRDKYFAVGLINTEISTIVKEDPQTGFRNVSFIIDEGQRVRLTRVLIEGIYSMDAEEATEKFFSFAPSLVQRYYIQFDGIKSAGELTADYLRQKGYLSAKLDLVRYRFDDKREKAEVELFFTEGVQTKVRNIEFLGAINVSREDILELLGVESGEPFNVFQFEEGLELLKEKYRNLGYLTVEISNEDSESVVSYSKDQSTVDVRLEIKEGPLVKVGDIFVRGNKQTHAKVVTRELPFIKGDILGKELLVEAEDNLRKLNLFTSLIVRPIERPGAPHIRDILILIEEGTPGLLEFGPGFRNDLGLRFFIGASYQNLGGWHRGVNANAAVNRRLQDFDFLEYNLNLGFREPYFAGWRVTLLTNFILLKRRFSTFDANISKATAEFRRQLTKNVTGLIQYSFERVKTFNAKVETDNEKRLIGAITPGVIWDSRNDIFNPSSGVYSINRFELAARAFGSQEDVGYYRATSRNSLYFGLDEDVVWSWGFNFGFERSNIEGKNIPKIKLFRLGGTGSVRGYREESLEVDSTEIINGTLAYVNYRSELRFPLEGALGMAVFWDAGNLFVDTVRPFKLRHSTGIGLRYNTPVGPVSLDFARKLGTVGGRGDRINVNDQDKQRVHFSIGNF